jgi:methylenetetrahydrofolate dehydrogenase (NADP+)/methenyltetrahydrofolate cyclohydrolase
MSILIDGKKVSNEISKDIKREISGLAIKPKLIIIQIGDLKASNVYVEKKIEFGKKVGAIVEYKKYDENIKEEEIISDIKRFNLDNSVHGIMVQLPIPKNFNTEKILDTIDYKKDVDGLTATNTRFLYNNKELFLPATTKGIITLLEKYNIDLFGKRVVIIGHSILVGKPTALAFLNRKATVTICNQFTKDLDIDTKRADIVVVAVGHPGLITKNHVNKDQTIIDIGISVLKDNKISGDVNFEEVKDIVYAITPVPGGVGPMTVLSLFENLVKAYKMSLEVR